MIRFDCPNRSPDGGNSFLSSIGGKLILYLVIPLFINFLISVFTFWFIRRRRRLRRNSRRGSQESTLSLHDSPSPIKDGSEKQWYLPSPRRPKLTPSRGSDRSSLTLSVIDVFIPYDEAKGKKQSNKWYNSLTTPSPSPSPQVGRRTERSVFAPAFGLSTVTDGTWPERSKSPDCPQRSQKSDRLGPSGSSSRLGTSNGRKERDEGMMSVLEENDATTSIYADSRRTTALPAYSPEATFTHYTPSDDGNSVIHGPQYISIRPIRPPPAGTLLSNKRKPRSSTRSGTYPPRPPLLFSAIRAILLSHTNFRGYGAASLLQAQRPKGGAPLLRVTSSPSLVHPPQANEE